MTRRIHTLLLIVLLSTGLLMVLGGCSSKHYDISAESGDKDRYSPADDIDRKPDPSPGERPEETAYRPPFVNLSTYKWDYQAWLNELRDLIATVRMPDSTEAMVTLTFYPGHPEPRVEVTCETPPDACERLQDQIAQLPPLPPLPDDFSEPELEVVLSRVPR